MDDKKYMTIMERREFMKGYTAHEESFESDQGLGKPQPSITVSARGDKIIRLDTDFSGIFSNSDIYDIFKTRVSRRKYNKEALSIKELSFLLWATQGVRKVMERDGGKQHITMRNVPSAGARHPFETYLFVNNVEGLETGIYHYSAVAHVLEYMGETEDRKDKAAAAFFGQVFVANAPVAFIWTAVPYRSEWRYSTKAQKYALIDAGHVCENLYLACEAIKCGTCAIGAYD